MVLKKPKKVLKMVLKTHLEPFREPSKVPPVGQPKNFFFSKSVDLKIIYTVLINKSCNRHVWLNAE